MTRLDDINVFYINFPNVKSREAVCKNEDGTYTIFIDARLSAAGAVKAYNHAVRHIARGDFDRYGSVNEIEAVAHG